jgi:hypothetical protein
MVSVDDDLSRNSGRIFDTGIINGGEQYIPIPLAEVKVGNEK